MHLTQFRPKVLCVWFSKMRHIYGLICHQRIGTVRPLDNLGQYRFFNYQLDYRLPIFSLSITKDSVPLKNRYLDLLLKARTMPKEDYFSENFPIWEILIGIGLPLRHTCIGSPCLLAYLRLMAYWIKFNPAHYWKKIETSSGLKRL